jgi:hypothetical protein
MVNHQPRIVYQAAGLSYKEGFSIKVNGVSEKNSSPSIWIVVIFCISVAPTLSNCGYAQERTFTAQLSGNQEVPPNNSAAKGRAWFI